MPGMTGVQLIAAIRDLGLTVPTMLASGYAELPREAEKIPRITKPFTDADLAAAIAALTRAPANGAPDQSMEAMRV